MSSPPEGFEFTIRTPGTPGRWTEYDEELSAVWGKLTAVVCDGDVPWAGEAANTSARSADRICDLILEVGVPCNLEAPDGLCRMVPPHGGIWSVACCFFSLSCSRLAPCAVKEGLWLFETRTSWTRSRFSKVHQFGLLAL